MKIDFGFRARLAIAQAGKLFGVAKEKLDLKPRFVIVVEPLGLQVDIRAEEYRIAVAVGVDDDYHMEIPFQLHMVEHLMIQHDVLIFGLQALKARQIAPVDFAIIGLLATWTWTFGPLVEITQMGIGSQLANLVQLQGPYARNEFLFAVRAIGDDVTQEAQIMRLDHTAQLVQIDIHAGGLGIRCLSTCWCLLHTECVSAVVGDVEPSQSREFKPFFGPTMAAVPKATQALGMRATFGHEARVHDHGLLMLSGDDRGDGAFVERDPVKGAAVPPGECLFVIGAVATQIAKGGVAREHEQKSQQRGDKLVLRFLGLVEPTQYTLEQSHGGPPVSVACDNTTLMEEDACGYSSIKTVRSIDCCKVSVLS